MTDTVEIDQYKASDNQNWNCFSILRSSPENISAICYTNCGYNNTSLCRDGFIFLMKYTNFFSKWCTFFLLLFHYVLCVKIYLCINNKIRLLQTNLFKNHRKTNKSQTEELARRYAWVKQYILQRNTEEKPIQLHYTIWRRMKNVLRTDIGSPEWNFNVTAFRGSFLLMTKQIYTESIVNAAVFGKLFSFEFKVT